MGYAESGTIQRIMKRSILILLLFFVLPDSVLAGSDFVTIINPVRLPKYNRDPLPSLKTQYEVVKSYGFPATWLFTYDSLKDSRLINLAKNMDSSQEKGIFLEVSPALAQASEVTYHESGSWHFATSVFLSGYTQEERARLIDTVFSQFKSQFGYYPVSVGSWWTDSFSLSYMKDKYAILANLTCSDQFSTDNYQIWGQYWSTPFYPHKSHAGIPADSQKNKIGIVNLQWAPRDPLFGYISSLYSTQDYFVVPEKKLDINYFDELLKLYTTSQFTKFSQISIGLESDLSPQTYTGEYSLQLDKVKDLSQAREIKIVTMKNFATWYTNTFPDGTPPHVIYTSDAIWYQSPRYRIGIVYQNNQTKIIDLREYPQNFQEPYYTFANRDRNLSINIPSLIDSLQNPDKAQIIYSGPIKSVDGDSQSFKVNFASGNLVLSPNGYTLNGKKFTPENTWPIAPPGYIFRGLNIESIHLLKSPRQLFKGWKQLGTTFYLVSQEELNALYYLAKLPFGKVVVVDNECLQCSWQGKFKPAVFSNLRSYVSKFSRKPIVYNSSVFKASTKPEARKLLQNLHAKYIYVVSYGEYFEFPPFSPGDLNIEKIFANANTQIWQILPEK